MFHKQALKEGRGWPTVLGLPNADRSARPHQGKSDMTQRMAVIINRANAPSHLLEIPELDFSKDLFSERLAGPWFRLGARTISLGRRDVRGVADVVSRQTLLLAPDGFAHLFDKLEFVGDVVYNLGKPGGSVLDAGEGKEYQVCPFPPI